MKRLTRFFPQTKYRQVCKCIYTILYIEKIYINEKYNNSVIQKQHISVNINLKHGLWSLKNSSIIICTNFH